MRDYEEDRKAEELDSYLRYLDKEKEEDDE
jgi:hypothetical protein